MIKKTWYVHSMEFYSARKGKEILPSVTAGRKWGHHAKWTKTHLWSDLHVKSEKAERTETMDWWLPGTGKQGEWGGVHQGKQTSSFKFWGFNIQYNDYRLFRWLSNKESVCNTGDPGSTPGSGRSPGVGNGNPLQYSCLENSTDRGTWWVTVTGGCQKSDTAQWLTHRVTIVDNTVLYKVAEWMIRLKIFSPPPKQKSINVRRRRCQLIFFWLSFYSTCVSNHHLT